MDYLAGSAQIPSRTEGVDHIIAFGLFAKDLLAFECRESFLGVDQARAEFRVFGHEMFSLGRLVQARTGMAAKVIPCASMLEVYLAVRSSTPPNGQITPLATWMGA